MTSHIVNISPFLVWAITEARINPKNTNGNFIGEKFKWLIFFPEPF